MSEKLATRTSTLLPPCQAPAHHHRTKGTVPERRLAVELDAAFLSGSVLDCRLLPASALETDAHSQPASPWTASLVSPQGHACRALDARWVEAATGEGNPAAEAQPAGRAPEVSVQ